MPTKNVICLISIKGAAWLSRVQRGSVSVQRGSVGAAWLSQCAAWLSRVQHGSVSVQRGSVGAAWLSQCAAWLIGVQRGSVRSEFKSPLGTPGRFFLSEQRSNE